MDLRNLVLSGLILTLLRGAGEPLPTRERIRRSMEARGLNVADKGLYELMRERIGASLRGMRSRRRLASGGDRGNGVQWSVANRLIASATPMAPGSTLN